MLTMIFVQLLTEAIMAGKTKRAALVLTQEQKGCIHIQSAPHYYP